MKTIKNYLTVTVLVNVVFVALIFALARLLLGCGPNEVSFSTVEDARAQAKENGTKNAQMYRAELKLADYDIYPRGDSTISNTCPNGDGWVSIDLTQQGTARKIKLKCSTVSVALGCMTEDDFKTKTYAQEEGNCQPLNKVPHPLPKLSK